MLHLDSEHKYANHIPVLIVGTWSARTAAMVLVAAKLKAHTLGTRWGMMWSKEP